MITRWLYEPDEDPKRKHHWANDWAGFEEQDGEIVGKCPKSMTTAEAERLLNSQGVSWHNPKLPEGLWPDRIYVVHDGVVYRAKPTRIGKSFHAFPERPASIPKAARRRILALADELGCREGVEEWLSR